VVERAFDGMVLNSYFFEIADEDQVIVRVIEPG
jgi:hypothetical protein